MGSWNAYDADPAEDRVTGVAGRSRVVVNLEIATEFVTIADTDARRQFEDGTIPAIGRKQERIIAVGKSEITHSQPDGCACDVGLDQVGGEGEERKPPELHHLMAIGIDDE